MSNKISKNIPNIIPKYFSDRILENMPNKMSNKIQKIYQIE
jgi:hypothetical protein